MDYSTIRDNVVDHRRIRRSVGYEKDECLCRTHEPTGVAAPKEAWHEDRQI